MTTSDTRGATRQLYLTEKRSTLIYWPEDVDERLNALHQLIASTGEQASRAHILAALVMAAPQDGDQLADLVEWYRRLEAPQPDSVHPTDAPRRRPGHRRPTGGEGPGPQSGDLPPNPAE
jgi:hypothetical protein